MTVQSIVMRCATIGGRLTALYKTQITGTHLGELASDFNRGEI
jgi:hypothetical protein